MFFLLPPPPPLPQSKCYLYFSRRCDRRVDFPLLPPAVISGLWTQRLRAPEVSEFSNRSKICISTIYTFPMEWFPSYRFKAEAI